MVTEYFTENIDKTAYDKIIRNIITFNGDDGTDMSGWKAYRNFEDTWVLNIIPTSKQEDYVRYYNHLNIEASDGMAWGVTGKKVIYMFVVDTKNPFVLRSNVMPLAHELLHAIYQDAVGTSHITRKYNSPEGRAGTKGAMATVIVHDNWYGSKEKMKFWVRYGVIWLPITIPYIPIKKAKELYNI
jgi:hypothetical protein